MKTGKGFIEFIGFVTPGDHHFIYMFIQICEWRNGSFICFKYCKASSRLSTAGLEQFIDTSRWKNLLTFQKQNIESINTILYGIISKSFIDWLNDLSLFCARRRYLSKLWYCWSYYNLNKPVYPQISNFSTFLITFFFRVNSSHCHGSYIEKDKMKNHKHINRLWFIEESSSNLFFPCKILQIIFNKLLIFYNFIEGIFKTLDLSYSNTKVTY